MISHREYVGDLSSGTFVPGTTSTGFSISRYQLNPGNSALFPWLSAAADSFQEYEVNGMLIELVTEASEVSTNLALGIMAMAAEYNPLAETPLTKQQMLELEYADVCKTSHSLIMPIECSRVNDAETHLFLAQDNNYLGTDARTFDLAAVFIASAGQPAENTKIAEIWVTYEIFLFKPKLPFLNSLQGGRATTVCALGGQPFGAASTVFPGSAAGFGLPTDDIVSLPPTIGAYWLLLFYVDRDLLSTVNFSGYTFFDAEVVVAWEVNAGSEDDVFISDTVANDPARGMFAVVVKVAGAVPRVQYGFDDLLAGSVGTLYALPVPAQLVTGVSLLKKAEQAERGRITHPKSESPVNETKSEQCSCCSKSHCG